MGEDTFVFYRALGIKLLSLYGQTESSAYNAIQSLDEVRLRSDARYRASNSSPAVGEILIRSGSVFSGYFKQEEATRQSLEDGWLHTGDAGYVEPDGHLVVLGRLSDVVHTAKGERYIPNYIENRLKFTLTSRTPRCSDAAATRWQPWSASTRTRSASGRNCAESPTSRMPICPRNRR